MNEQTRESTHTDDATARLSHEVTHEARGCDRAEDLVAHLYGEATPAEDASFRRHLHACAVCRDELAAFRGLRELVGAERAEVLGAAPALDVHALLAQQAGEVETGNGADTLPLYPTASRRRSAVAAFREFFALSPLWLRAGAAACALLVCALAALTVARAEVRWDASGIAFRAGSVGGTGTERVVEKRVEVPVQTGFTREQVDALVAERLKDEREAREALSRELQQARDNSTAAATAGRKRAEPRMLAAGDAPRTQPRKRVAPTGARRDEQLAEDDLPRLSDLLGGAY